MGSQGGQGIHFLSQSRNTGDRVWRGRRRPRLLSTPWCPGLSEINGTRRPCFHETPRGVGAVHHRDIRGRSIWDRSSPEFH